MSHSKTLKLLQRNIQLSVYDCTSFNGLIELPNHCVAVSGGESLTIDIKDTQKHQLIKQIVCKGYLDNEFLTFSSLHLLNNGTIIYSHNGCFCQISSTTYEILKIIKMEKEFEGRIIISSSNRKYITCEQ